MAKAQAALEASPLAAYHVCSIYNEGPFIALEKKGGLPAESLRDFTAEYMEQLLSFRSQVRKVLPEALSVKHEGGLKSFEDVSEEIQNQKELRQLLDRSAERAIRYGEEQQRRQQVQKRHEQTQQNVTY